MSTLESIIRELDAVAVENHIHVSQNPAADVDSLHAALGQEKDTESARRKAIRTYHDSNTSDWRTGDSSFTVVTLLHPVTVGGLHHTFKIGRIVAESTENGRVWRKRRSLPLVQIRTDDSGNITAARFVTGKGESLRTQSLSEKRLAANLIAKAYRVGFTSAYDAMRKASAESISDESEDFDGWDDLSEL